MRSSLPTGLFEPAERAIAGSNGALLNSPGSVLKKCFASGSEGFRSQGRQQNVSESGDSLEFGEPDSSKPWVGAKAPPQGKVTFSTGC